MIVYLDVQFTQMYSLPRCIVYPDVQFTQMYSLLRCIVYPDVQLTQMHSLPRCIVYPDVQFTQMYIVYPDVQFSQMYMIHVYAVLSCTMIGVPWPRFCQVGFDLKQQAGSPKIQRWMVFHQWMIYGYVPLQENSLKNDSYIMVLQWLVVVSILYTLW